MSYAKWSRENRLKKALTELTEDTVIVRKTPIGFIVILRHMGTEIKFQMNKYVTLEKARRLLTEAQRQIPIKELNK
jgi:hypothetical protein